MLDDTFMTTQNIIYSLFPLVSMVVSVLALYFSRKDKGDDQLRALTDQIDHLRHEVEIEREKNERRTRHFAVSLARHIPEYKNGVE